MWRCVTCTVASARTPILHSIVFVPSLIFPGHVSCPQCATLRCDGGSGSLHAEGVPGWSHKRYPLLMSATCCGATAVSQKPVTKEFGVTNRPSGYGSGGARACWSAEARSISSGCGGWRATGCALATFWGPSHPPQCCLRTWGEQPACPSSQEGEAD